MFSQFSNFIKNAEEESLFGSMTHIRPYSNKWLTLFIVSVQTGKLLTKIPIPLNVIKDFIDGLHFEKNVFKAIVIDIFEIDDGFSQYKTRHNFRKHFKEKLNELKVANYFICSGDAVNTMFLITANINIETDETVLIVTNVSEKIRVVEYKFTEAGYDLIRHENFTLQNSREEILGSSNPKKIILFKNNKNQIVNKLVKSCKLIVLNENVGNCLENYIVQTCKWILDKSYVKFHIIPIYRKNVDICCFYGTNCNEIHMLKVNGGEKLPFAKSTQFPRSVYGCTVAFIDDKDGICFGPSLERNFHRFAVTLLVDAETIESYSFQKVPIKQIHSLPKDLKNISGPKLPVIGLFDNSSVILIYDKFCGYKFLKSWNEIQGRDLFMSFDRKKQKYFEDAWRQLGDKHSFVVFDLLKIMSMPPNNIPVSNTWGFKITNDDENPVLLEFDNFDGTKKCSSPSFLMAVLLRKHLKAIEDEIGKKPNEIAFWIYNELNEEKQFDKEEMKRIKEGLEESCKLLKISCNFVKC